MNTIFNKIGGMESIGRIVSEFSNILRNDSRIPALVNNPHSYDGWIRFVEAITKDESYDMAGMASRHIAKQVPAEQYDFLVEDFVVALKNTNNSIEIQEWFKNKLNQIKQAFL